MVLTIVLSVLAGWLLVSVLLALFIGRVIRLADRRAPQPIASRPARLTRTAARDLVVHG